MARLTHASLQAVKTGVYAEAPAEDWPIVFPVISFMKHIFLSSPFKSDVTLFVYFKQ